MSSGLSVDYFNSSVTVADFSEQDDIEALTSFQRTGNTDDNFFPA